MADKIDGDNLDDLLLMIAAGLSKEEIQQRRKDKFTRQTNRLNSKLKEGVSDAKTKEVTEI